MRKTKIICTFSPKSTDEKIMKELLLEGMNVARSKATPSHGDYEEHMGKYRTLLKLREELNLPVAALLRHKRTGNPSRNFQRWDEGESFRGAAFYIDNKRCGG